jgi:hypothetical protein
VGAPLTARRPRLFPFAHPGSRYATAALQGIRPRPATVPTGTIALVCGTAACPQRHSTDQPLSLTLRLPAAFAAASIQWTSDQVALAGSGLNLSSPDLTIPGSMLPQAGAATIASQLTLAGQTGVASITVPLNGAPSCAGPASTACVSVSNKTDVFPGAEFTVAAVNVADDGGAADLRRERPAAGALLGNLLLEGLLAFALRLNLKHRVVFCVVGTLAGRRCRTPRSLPGHLSHPQV